MLEFKKPQIEDKKWVDALLTECSKGCEFCFGNIFIWSDVYNTCIAKYNNTLVIRYKVDSEYSYSFSNSENLCGLINELLENANKHNQVLKLYGLTKDEKDILEKEMPGSFEFAQTREYFDYVYKTEDLINLSGRKYHQKRNHISYLKNNFVWKYESINDSNIEECRVFNRNWERHNENKNPDELSDENIAIQKALDNYTALGFVGGLLRVDGRIEAYTFGEPLNDRIFCTHIEKANADLRGAYALINQQFAEKELSSYIYVDREEDTGSEGLRQAKLSYHPDYLIEVCFARYIK